MSTCIDCTSEMLESGEEETYFLYCESCGSHQFPEGTIGPYLIGSSCRDIEDYDFLHCSKGMEGLCPSCANHTVEYGNFFNVAFQKCTSCETLFFSQLQVAEAVNVLRVEANEDREERGVMYYIDNRDWKGLVRWLLVRYFTYG